MTLQEALDVVYVDAMKSDSVQQFATNHPGKKLTIRATVTVQDAENPECRVEGTYDGYELLSDKAQEKTQ